MDFLTYCHMFLLSSLFRCHSLHNKKYKFRHECSGVVELFHSHISFGTKIHWIILVFLSALSPFSYFVGDVALGHQLWQPPPRRLGFITSWEFYPKPIRSGVGWSSVCFVFLCSLVQFQSGPFTLPLRHKCNSTKSHTCGCWRIA